MAACLFKEVIGYIRFSPKQEWLVCVLSSVQGIVFQIIVIIVGKSSEKLEKVNSERYCISDSEL